MRQPYAVALAFLCGIGAGGMCSLGVQFGGRKAHLQSTRSPDGSHRADLYRRDGIDRNYSVVIDGTTVYRSPDFGPRKEVPFREALFWSRDSTLLILEIAGHRIFGYDAARKRPLTTAELLAAEAPPEPPLWDYGFSGDWPGIGRVLRPDRVEPHAPG